MSKQRIFYLDVLRAIACLMVILMHSPMPGVATGHIVNSAISFVTAAGLVLFFMISGSLLLPVTIGSRDFMRRRMGKVLWPTLFWTLFYVSVNLLTGSTTLAELPKVLLSIPFATQGHGILWFMYTLIGLYIVSLIISPWLLKASRREVEGLLILWGITMCFPLLRLVVDVNESATGMYYYVSGFAGYFLLGYYLRRYEIRPSRWIVVGLFALPLCVAATVKLLGWAIDFYSLFWYLSVFVAMMAVAWFAWMQRSVGPYQEGLRWHRWVVNFSNCSFGIYLIHIFVMRHLLWNCDFIQIGGGNCQIVLTFVLTTAISYIIVYLISLHPVGKYIVGFSR